VRSSGGRRGRRQASHRDDSASLALVGEQPPERGLATRGERGEGVSSTPSWQSRQASAGPCAQGDHQPLGPRQSGGTGGSERAVTYP